MLLKTNSFLLIHSKILVIKLVEVKFLLIYMLINWSSNEMVKIIQFQIEWVKLYHEIDLFQVIFSGKAHLEKYILYIKYIVWKNKYQTNNFVDSTKSLYSLDKMVYLDQLSPGSTKVVVRTIKYIIFNIIKLVDPNWQKYQDKIAVDLD